MNCAKSSLEYSATNSDGTKVEASVTGTTLSLIPVDLGTATLTVTARDRPTSDPEGLTASQSFTVTVDYLPVVAIAPDGSATQDESVEEIRFTLTADPAPSEATEVKISVSQQGADYLTGAIPTKIGFAKGSTSETLTLQVEDDSTGEPDGNIRVSILHLPGDPYTPGNPRTAQVTIRDNDTLTLNVEPMPLRRARVSWNPLPQAEGYELEIQREGGTWTTPPTVAYTADDSERIVDLDHILETPAPANDPLGMADGNFEFRIRAHQTTGGMKEYTAYSQTIRIVENPLTAPRGRAFVPNNIGTAELAWIPQGNATNHTVRYRRLDSYRETIRPGSTPCTDRSQAPPVFHNHDAWPVMPDWPNYEETARAKSLTGSLGEITGLTNCWLYALQLNYEVPDPAGTGKVRVFSANDAYVWPSPSQFPEANQQVATYPFFGHHASRTFNYAICTHTFEHPNEWRDVINEAFQKWSTTTNGFITVAPYAPTPTGACTTGPSDPEEPDYAFHMRLLMMADDQYNEVRMFDLPDESHIYSFPEFKSDVFKLCITKADACVTSFTGYSALDPSNIQQRLDIAEALESPRSPANFWNILFNYIPEASEGDLEPGEAIQSVDISFKKSKDIPIGTLRIPTRTDFNICQPTTSTNEYKAYKLALHEAGHALVLQRRL